MTIDTGRRTVTTEWPEGLGPYVGRPGTEKRETGEQICTRSWSMGCIEISNTDTLVGPRDPGPDQTLPTDQLPVTDEWPYSNPMFLLRLCPHRHPQEMNPVGGGDRKSYNLEGWTLTHCPSVGPTGVHRRDSRKLWWRVVSVVRDTYSQEKTETDHSSGTREPDRVGTPYALRTRNTFTVPRKTRQYGGSKNVTIQERSVPHLSVLIEYETLVFSFTL